MDHRNFMSGKDLSFFSRIGLAGLGLMFFVGTFGSMAVVDAAGPPEWIDGSSVEYPAKRFLIGVGQADTRSAAEDRAYAAISRIFKVEINAKSEEWEQYLQSDTGGETQSSRQIGIKQATKVSTGKVLENVRVAEIWEDKSQALYYALAVMDRQQVLAGLRERVTSLDLRVEELLKESRQSSNKLQAVQALYGAVQNLLLREVYNVDLRIVDPAGRGSEGITSLEDVSRRLRKFLAENFRIAVEVEGSNQDRIRAAIVEGLNRRGLPVVRKAGSREMKPDLVIRGSVTLDPVELPEAQKGVHYVRWSAAFELTDTTAGQVIGSVVKKGREGHLSVSEARARALRVSEEKVTEAMSRQIAKFIYGEVEE